MLLYKKDYDMLSHKNIITWFDNIPSEYFFCKTDDDVIWIGYQLKDTHHRHWAINDDDKMNNPDLTIQEFRKIELPFTLRISNSFTFNRPIVYTINSWEDLCNIEELTGISSI